MACKHATSRTRYLALETADLSIGLNKQQKLYVSQEMGKEREFSELKPELKGVRSVLFK
jgi:hypothetical protein